MPDFSGPLNVDGALIANIYGAGLMMPRTPTPGAKVLYVCSDTRLPAGDGTSGSAPLRALFGSGGALERIAGRQNYGDIIYVLPGHSENVSAADMGSLMGSAKGFSIIGIGRGTERPKLIWTAAAATLLLDTDNVEIANMQLFLAGATDSTTALTVAAAITVSGAGCRLINNFIQFGVDADQIVTLGIVTTATADDLVFAGNFCEGAVAAEITATGTFLRLVGADRAIIVNNVIMGALATDADGLIETLTTASTGIVIQDNYVYARGAGNTCAIDMGANLACTGVMRRNLLVVDADATAETVVWTRHANNNMALLDNFLVNDNNERGLVIGTASV